MADFIGSSIFVVCAGMEKGENPPLFLNELGQVPLGGCC